MPSFSALNAYYAADIPTFLGAEPRSVLGEITANSAFGIDPDQRDAWVLQIQLLQTGLLGIQGTVFLEFNVPRIGSRLDAVLISGPAIYPIEFKVGETQYIRDHVNQVWDYGLDLKNFHQASHSAPIYPISCGKFCGPTLAISLSFGGMPNLLRSLWPAVEGRWGGAQATA